MVVGVVGALLCALVVWYGMVYQYHPYDTTVREHIHTHVTSTIGRTSQDEMPPRHPFIVIMVHS